MTAAEFSERSRGRGAFAICRQDAGAAIHDPVTEAERHGSADHEPLNSQETVAEVPLTGLSFTREGNAPQPDPRRGHDHRRFRITRQRAIATAAIAVEASGNPGTMPRFVF